VSGHARSVETGDIALVLSRQLQDRSTVQLGLLRTAAHSVRRSRANETMTSSILAFYSPIASHRLLKLHTGLWT
jgi:hypothetical protein